MTNNIHKYTVGHIAEACAEAESLCYNCKQAGHISTECTEPKVVVEKTCYNCGKGICSKEREYIYSNNNIIYK